MLTWSTSTTNYASFKNAESKITENFLKSWDAAVFEGDAIDDSELNKEAQLWREKFVHLRIVGQNCEDSTRQKVTKQKSTKSAYTSRDISLPPIKK